MSALKSRFYRLLRFSERYTKTDMVYVASGGFWSVAGQVVTAFIIFGFAVLVARYLPKDVYGEYKYILATIAILSSLSLTGIGTAVFQSVASGFDGSLFKGFWANLRWSVLIFIGAFVLAAYYFSQGNATLAFGFLIGGSLSPFLTSANLSASFLNAKKDFKRSSMYFNIIENIIAVGALAITVLITNSALALVIVYFAGNVLATYLLYRRTVRLYKPDPTKTDSGMLTYAKHLSLMEVLSTIANNIDQVLLFSFVGPVQLAVYNFAIAIPDQTRGPLKMFNSMLQAKFVIRTDVEIRAGMKNKMFWLGISSVVFIVLYIIIAPWFYDLFFPNYIDAVPYSQLYVISLLSMIFIPASSYLTAKKKVYEQYLINIIPSLFQIATLVVGIIWWGLLGLVVARIITRLFLSSFSYTLYRYRNSTTLQPQ